MQIKKSIWLILMSLVLTACTIPSFLLPADVANDTTDQQSQSVLPTSNLAPVAIQVTATQVPPTVTVPAAIKLTATPTKNARLLAGKATVKEAAVNVMMGPPAVYSVDVTGTLPSQCDGLKADIGKPDGSRHIQITVSSIHDPGKICTESEVTFAANFIIDKLKTGKYTVTVNDVEAGSFDVQ